MSIDHSASLPLHNVSRETSDKLKRYTGLIRKWNPHINLVSTSDLPHLETRHIEDSLQLASLIDINSNSTACDLGSGGGLPAIPLSLVSHYQWKLIESDNRKCAFLRNVIADLAIKNATVLNKRAELITQKAELITARALANLNKLFSYSHPMMEKNAICVFLKGENWDKEIDEASLHWSFSHESYPSVTSSKSRIVIIRNLEPK